MEQPSAIRVTLEPRLKVVDDQALADRQSESCISRCTSDW